MKVQIQFLALAGLLSLSGCGNNVNFSGQSAESSFELVPILLPDMPPPQPVPDSQTPPVVETPPDISEPPPPPLPPVFEEPLPLNLKNGTCAVGKNEKILSCLNCESTAPIAAPPLLSRKAQELLDIMTTACSIQNRSDEKDYVAPTYDQLLKRVIQCSPTAYPDTQFLSTQGRTIHQLLHNPVAQQNAFGGLYYNSASTDFETYFGLEIGEARYTFCRRLETFGLQGVYPKEYYDSLYSGRPYMLPSIYVKAQKNRIELRNCLAESLRNPDVPQRPGTPGIDCSYESAEGPMSALIVDQVNQWQTQGHTVYFEGFNQCGVMERPEQFLDHNTTQLKIAIKKCQELKSKLD